MVWCLGVSMSTLVAIGSLLVLIIVLTFIIGKPEHMEEKRTYMFEDETGERYNQFSDITDGAEGDSDSEWKYHFD